METVKKNINDIKCMHLAVASAISCSLTGVADGDRIIGLNANARFLNAEYTEGECKITARVLFSALIEGENGTECIENAAEFDAKFLNADILENSLLFTDFSVESLTSQKDGDQYRINAIINSEAHFCIKSQAGAVVKIDEAIEKNRQEKCIEEYDVVFDEGEFEGESLTSSPVAKILFHEENARVLNARCGINQVTVEGEVYSEFIYITENGKIAKENLTVPFSYEIECNGCRADFYAVAWASVNEVNYKVLLPDEQKNSVQLTALVKFCVAVYSPTELQLTEDAFLKTGDLQLKRDKTYICTFAANKPFLYKSFGEAVCEKGDKSIIAALGGNVNALNYKCENGKLQLSGTVRTSVVTSSEGGELSTTFAELPFSCTFNCEGEPFCVHAFAKNVTAKSLEEKCLMECEIVFDCACYSRTQAEYISDVTMGEQRKTEQSAINIIFIEKGDDMWSVCKKARVSESVLIAQNPELVLPAEKHSAIVVYNKAEM